MNLKFTKDITDIAKHYIGREFIVKVLCTSDDRQVVSVLERDGNVIWVSSVSEPKQHIKLSIEIVEEKSNGTL